MLTEVEKYKNRHNFALAFSSETTLLHLTPSDLLALESASSFVEPVNLRRLYLHSWRLANYPTNALWRRWLRENMSPLETRQSWMHSTRPFIGGNVVVSFGKRKHISSWTLEVVKQVITNSDRLMRAVSLRTSRGTLTRKAPLGRG